MRLVATVFALSLAGVGFGADLVAQPVTTARCADVDTQVDRGIELRRRGRDEDALRLFQELHARCSSPRVIAQVAMAEHALERWPAAWEHMRAALSASDDPWVASRRAALETLRDEILPHMARVSPTTETSGAELVVNGARAGALPLTVPFVVAPGVARVEVRAPGYEPFVEQVTLVEGQWYRSNVTLRVARASDLDPGRGRRITGFVLVGVGAALAAFGAVQWVRSFALQSDTAGAMTDSPGDLGDWYNYQRAVYGSNPPDGSAVCASARENPGAGAAYARGVVSLCDEADVLRWTSLGAGLGGVVLAGVGVALVVTAPSRRVSAFRFSPMAGPGHVGALLEVRF